MQHFNQRRIQPQRHAVECLHALAPSRTLADNRRSRHITRFQRMHKNLALAVNELRTNRAHLLGNQRTVNLRRISNTGRMILDSVSINQRCSGTICHNKTVRSRAVMVRGRKALIMQTASAARSHDYAFCTHNLVLLRVKIPQHCTSSFALFIQQQLNSRRKLQHWNAAVLHLVAQHAHNLCTGIIGAGMHTLTARAAAMCRHHRAVLLLVEHNAQLAQPVNCQRSVAYQLLQKLRNIFVVTAAKGIQIMLRRRIVSLIRSLNTALSHHGVGIAHAQLRHYEDISAAVMCFQCRGRTSAAAADNQHINVIVHFF